MSTPLTEYNYQFLLLSEYLKDRVLEEEKHLESVRKLASDDSNFDAYLKTLEMDQKVMALLQNLCVKDHGDLLTLDAIEKCITQLERESKGSEAVHENDVNAEIFNLVRRLKRSRMTVSKNQ